ncbi:MAG: hypothetical protein ACFFCV_10970 [Promethearchaeota archaeon]
MIKCLNCDEAFSYGRKICCCHSTYFGNIFNENRREHKWNCDSLMNIKVNNEILKKDNSEINVIDFERPFHYDWNCETSLRLTNQRELIERAYVLIYE